MCCLVQHRVGALDACLVPEPAGQSTRAGPDVSGFGLSGLGAKRVVAVRFLDLHQRMRPCAQIVVAALAVDVMDEYAGKNRRGVVVEPRSRSVLDQEILPVRHSVAQQLHDAVVFDARDRQAGLGMDRNRIHESEGALAPGAEMRGTVAHGSVPRSPCHEAPIAQAMRGGAVVVEIGQSEEVPHLMADHADANDARAARGPQRRLSVVPGHLDAVLRDHGGHAPLVRPDAHVGQGVAVFLPVARMNDGETIHPAVAVRVALSEVEPRRISRIDGVDDHLSWVRIRVSRSVERLGLRQLHPHRDHGVRREAAVRHLAVIVPHGTDGSVGDMPDFVEEIRILGHRHASVGGVHGAGAAVPMVGETSQNNDVLDGLDARHRNPGGRLIRRLLVGQSWRHLDGYALCRLP